MRRLVCLAAFALLATPKTAIASSITFSGTATVGGIGCTTTTDSFSYTNQTSATDSASVSIGCLELVGGNVSGPFTRSALIDATLSDNTLQWSGATVSSPGQTDASGSVTLAYDDILTITQGGSFDVTLHVSGTGTISPSTGCSGYSFTGRLSLDSVQVANVGITPCSSVTDVTYSFTATTGQTITMFALFRGTVGAAPGLFGATFDGTNTGIITISPQGSAAFASALGLTYGSDATPVPEPATLALLSLGLTGLAGRRLRRA